MERSSAFTATVAAVAMLVVGCSGSDDGPGGITRIDGPAQVDDDVRVGSGGSSEG